MTQKENFTLGIKRIPFNAKMRRTRLKKGLSQKQLATLLNIPCSYIQQIETMRVWPREAWVHGIADVLGLKPNDIFPKWMERKLIPPKTNSNIYINVGKVSLTASELLQLPTESSVSEKEIDKIDSSFLKKKVKKAMLDLKPLERKVLEMRFGLDRVRPMTLEEVGREFGVTRTRIAQIEAKALRRIKRPGLRAGLGAFL